jgi:hypothetical protein
VFRNNVIWDFRPIGVSFSGSKNVTFDRNVVANIKQRTTLGSAHTFEDKEACIVTCTYFSTSDKCPDTYVTNNIAAGCFWVGMTLNGHECGNPASSKSFGNVVHSVSKSKGGVGAIISPDRSSSTQVTTCFEGSGVISYKNRYQGVMFQGAAGQKVIFSNMTAIDNALGIGVGLAMKGPNEYKDVVMELNDNKIYGESPAPDCPPDGGYCQKFDKCGFMTAVALHGAKPIHPTMPSPKPYHKCKSYGSWGATAIHRRNEFINFYSTTSSGAP